MSEKLNYEVRDCIKIIASENLTKNDLMIKDGEIWRKMKFGDFPTYHKLVYEVMRSCKKGEIAYLVGENTSICMQSELK